MPQVGETAPDFEMLNDEGNPIKLSDFRGKKVVLYFYPADFTSGCELQACSFRDVYPKITDKNAVVIGVSPDNVDSHQKFREALHLPFTLLVDPDAEQAKAWGAWGTRTYSNGTTYTGLQRSQFIIDENGKFIDVQAPISAKDSVPKTFEVLGIEEN
jgi:thioredoxin-dependent peroxiredoxin